MKKFLSLLLAVMMLFVCRPAMDAQARENFGADVTAYYGEWMLESVMGIDVAMLGMTMELTLNEDGTCTITDGDEIGRAHV